MAEAKSSDTIKLFYCYNSADRTLRDTLESHLAGLRRERPIESWSDLEVPPGTEYDSLVQEHLKGADVILVLISASFLASDYCYDVLMKLALERHYAGEAYFVPILLRPVFWKDTPLERLTRMCPMLPTSEKAVIDSSWGSEDEAFEDIIKGIRKIFKDVWLKKGDTYYRAKRYDSALAAFEQAIGLDSKFGPAYSRRGCVFHDLGRHQYISSRREELYSQARASFDTALDYNPMDAYTHYLCGNLLYDCMDYECAVSSFEKAIQLNHLLISAHIYKGLALEQQGKIEQALMVYDRYLELHPHDPLVTYFRREMLNRSKAKDFYGEMQGIMGQFVRSLEHFQRHYPEDPMRIFIGMMAEVRNGLREFQQAARPLVEKYSSWLRSLREMLESITTQQYDAIENPEIRMLLLTLLGTEARHLDARTRLIDGIRDYLQSLKDKNVYDVDRVIGDWDEALEQIFRQLEEQYRQSQTLLDTLHHTDREGLFSEERNGIW